ncbi:MAG: hypothetical protein JWP81_2720 [Ferruginibacter sp.]|nr:hypothetical protein [Ferruginibacter sp.]
MKNNFSWKHFLYVFVATLQRGTTPISFSRHPNLMAYFAQRSGYKYFPVIFGGENLVSPFFFCPAEAAGI